MPDFEPLFTALEGNGLYYTLFSEEQIRALNNARQNGGVEGLLGDNEDIRRGVAVALDDPAIRERLGEARDALTRIVGPVQRNFGPGVERRWGVTGIDPSEKVDPALEQWMEDNFSEEAVRTATAGRYGKGYDEIIKEELAVQSLIREEDIGLGEMQYTYPARHYPTLEYIARSLIPHYGARPVVLQIGAGLMPVPEKIPAEIASKSTSPQTIELALLLPIRGALKVVDISEEPLTAAKAKPVRMIFLFAGGVEIEKTVYLSGLARGKKVKEEHWSSPKGEPYHIVTFNDHLADRIETRRMDIATESYGPEKVDMIVCTHTAGFLQPDFWKNVHLIKMLGTIRVGGHLVITHFDDGLDPEMMKAFGYREVHRDPLHGRQSVFIYEHIRETGFARTFYDRIEKAQEEGRLKGMLFQIDEARAPAWDELSPWELPFYAEACYFYRFLRTRFLKDLAEKIRAMPVAKLAAEFRAFQADTRAIEKLSTAGDTNISSMESSDLFRLIAKIKRLKHQIVHRWSGFIAIFSKGKKIIGHETALEMMGGIAVNHHFDRVSVIEKFLQGKPELLFLLEGTCAKDFGPLTALEEKARGELKRRIDGNPAVVPCLIREIHRLPEPIEDDEVDRLMGLKRYNLAPTMPDILPPEARPDEKFIYAKTSYELWRRVLDRLKPHPDHDVIYDLGSGPGGLVLYAFMAAGVRTRGVELVAERRAEAEGAKGRLGFADDDVKFIGEDILSAPFEDGTIFYLYHPFSQRETIEKAMARLKDIARQRPIRIAALWVASDPSFEMQGDWLKEVYREESPEERVGFRLMMFESTIHPPPVKTEPASPVRLADGPPDGGGESAEDYEVLSPVEEGEGVSGPVTEGEEPEMNVDGLMAGMGVTGLVAATMPGAPASMLTRAVMRR